MKLGIRAGGVGEQRADSRGRRKVVVAPLEERVGEALGGVYEGCDAFVLPRIVRRVEARAVLVGGVLVPQELVDVEEFRERIARAHPARVVGNRHGLRRRERERRGLVVALDDGERGCIHKGLPRVRLVLAESRTRPRRGERAAGDRQRSNPARSAHHSAPLPKPLVFSL